MPGKHLFFPRFFSHDWIFQPCLERGNSKTDSLGACSLEPSGMRPFVDLGLGDEDEAPKLGIHDFSLKI